MPSRLSLLRPGRIAPVLRVLLALVALVALLAARGASAQSVWNEAGDAGELPGNAQFTAGFGSAATINGSLSSADDVDLYCIHITDPLAFFARITCLVTVDKDLWLFNAPGFGINSFDACTGGFVHLSSGFVPSAGFYLIGVSGDNADALNGANPIWVSGPTFVEHAPDGPGAAGALTGWGGTRSLFGSGAYSIQLGGCTFCDTGLPANQGTWGRIKTLYR